MIKKVLNSTYYFWCVFKGIVFERLPESIQSRIIDRKVRRVVKMASKVPYYKKKWREEGIDWREIKTKEDLRRLPVLERKEVSNNPDSFLYKKKGTFFKTSGSSGRREVSILYTDNSLIRNLAFSSRQRRNIKSFTMGKKIFVVRPKSAQSSYKLEDALNNLLYIPAFIRRKTKFKYFSILEPISKLYTVIQEEQAQVVGTYGSFINEFSDYVREKNLNPKYPKVFTYSSDICEENAKNYLKTKSINVLGTYNCIESMVIAYQRGDSDLYEIHKDAVVVELDKKGEAIITPLYNDGTILINYELGDRIKKEEGKISSIKGRAGYLVNDEGRKIASVGIGMALMKKGVGRYQIRQKKTSIIVKIMSEEDSNIKEYVEEKFSEMGFSNVKIKFVKALERDKNGKVILIKRED